MYVQDLVSIVVPVHNGEQFLCENVECILNQTYKFLEIIYVCDGCTDNTVDILQKYSTFDGRMKVHIEQDKHGAAFSRNIGMEMAVGDWIIFLDCDDLFEIEMIEKMVYRAVNERADMCCCFWEEFDEEPVRKAPAANTDIIRYCNTYPVINVSKEKKYILQLVIQAPWNKLVHKTIYQKETVCFQDLPNNNDVYFSFCSTAEAVKIVYVDEVFVHYRSSKGRNVLSNERKNIRNYVWEAYDKFYQYIEQKKNNRCLKQSFYNRVCIGIFYLMGCALFEELFKSLYENYFIRWGMQNYGILKELSYLNREIYKKLCTGNLPTDRTLIVTRAKEHFVYNTAQKGGCSIWGCGYRLRELAENLNFMDIGVEHLYDSDANKWETVIAGKVVEKYNGEWAKCIIITSSQFYEEIRTQIGGRADYIYNLEEEIFMY